MKSVGYKVTVFSLLSACHIISLKLINGVSYWIIVGEVGIIHVAKDNGGG
jgi:hypothetical protein